MQHSILTGYEFEYAPDRYTTTEEGGDFFPTSISLRTFQETQPPITSFPTAREGHFANRTNAIYWQDQISVTEHLKINVGGRYDYVSPHQRRMTSSTRQEAGKSPPSAPHRSTIRTRTRIAQGRFTNCRRASRSISARRARLIRLTLFPPRDRRSIRRAGRLYEFGHRWQSPEQQVHHRPGVLQD